MAKILHNWVAEVLDRERELDDHPEASDLGSIREEDVNQVSSSQRSTEDDA